MLQSARRVHMVVVASSSAHVHSVRLYSTRLFAGSGSGHRQAQGTGFMAGPSIIVYIDSALRG